MRMRLEILFPHSRVSGLKNLHDEDWKSLVERIAALPETHPDKLAFCLMMIRLNSCLNCVSGSYRFMRGCELCAHQTISRYQGTDEELIELHQRAKEDLARYAQDQIELEAESPEPEDWE